MTQALTQRLASPRARSGRVGELRFDARGIERRGEPVTITHVQLSRSRRKVDSWLLRLLGRDLAVQELLHVKLRVSDAEPITFSAVVQDRALLEGLPELALAAEPADPAALVELVETACAHGASLALQNPDAAPVGEGLIEGDDAVVGPPHLERPPPPPRSSEHPFAARFEKHRKKQILGGSIGLLIMLTFGIGGFLYAREEGSLLMYLWCIPWLAFFPFALRSLIRELYRRRVFYDGVLAVGTILPSKFNPTGPGEQPGTFMLRYRFRARDGELYTSRAALLTRGGPHVKYLQPEQPVYVLYLRDRPQHSLPWLNLETGEIRLATSPDA